MPRIWSPVNLAQFYRVNNLIEEELNYNFDELNTFMDENLDKLNPQQNIVFGCLGFGATPFNITKIIIFACLALVPIPNFVRLMHATFSKVLRYYASIK